MATPIVEQIAQAIKTRLETITTDNGYEIDVAAVTRMSRASLPTYENYEIVLVQNDAELEETPGGGTDMLQWVQTWDLQLAVKPADSSTAPVDQLVNTFAADVIKCVMSNDHTWGGLAIDTDIAAWVWFADINDGVHGCTLQINVTYRVDRDDPYTVR